MSERSGRKWIAAGAGVVVVGGVIAAWLTYQRPVGTTGESQGGRWKLDSVQLAQSFDSAFGGIDKSGRNPASAESEITAYLFALRKSDRSLSTEVLIRMGQRYDRLISALPIEEGLESNEVDSRDDWARAIGSFSPGLNGDEIAAIVSTEVRTPDGRAIRQVYDTSMTAVVSQAACAAGEPVIGYNPRALSGMSPSGVLFLQQHELAHFALDHVNCERRPPVDPAYTERAADCWAVARLSALNAGGSEAIGAASQFYAWLHEPAVPPHYEASDARSNYIYHRCT